MSKDYGDTNKKPFNTIQELLKVYSVQFRTQDIILPTFDGATPLEQLKLEIQWCISKGNCASLVANEMRATIGKKLWDFRCAFLDENPRTKMAEVYAYCRKEFGIGEVSYFYYF